MKRINLTPLESQAIQAALDHIENKVIGGTVAIEKAIQFLTNEMQNNGGVLMANLEQWSAVEAKLQNLQNQVIKCLKLLDKAK